MRRVLLTFGGLLVACGPASVEDLDEAHFSQTPSYEAQVRPLLTRYCTSCHTSDGERAGGVELDRYESAYSGRVHNVCVTVQEDVVARFSVALTPYRRSGQPPRAPCEGWEVGSMPNGARSRPTLEEQVILARWVEIGGPR